MRIAIVTSNASVIGGVERYLETVVPLLGAAGHEVKLFFEQAPPRGSRPIGPADNFPAWYASAIGITPWLEALRGSHPQVIYQHGLSDPEVEARLSAIAPVVAFAHDYRAVCVSGSKSFAFPAMAPCGRSFGAGCLGNFYPRRCGGLSPLTMLTAYRRASSWLAGLRTFDAVVTASDFVRMEYLRNGLAPDAVRSVGLPIVDRDGIPPSFAPGPAKGSDQRPLRLLFAGRMESRKGGQLLLEALPAVAVALARPLLATFAGDGPARRDWTQRADALRRSHPRLRVDFPGWLEPAALDAQFDSSDLLVMPSLWPEPFGQVGPEAGMRGLPAAAFAVGGIPEWRSDNVNGALAGGAAPSGAALADAIVRCLSDAAVHARLRRGAFELARRFRPGRHLDALHDGFEHVMRRAPETGREAVFATTQGSPAH
jgi:glycosyltransferase involved in cell wall biosynthesis